MKVDERHVTDRSIIVDYISTQPQHSDASQGGLTQAFTSQRDFGFTKTVITEKQLKTIILRRSNGFTKTLMSDYSTKTLTLPNITTRNDAFDTKLDTYRDDMRTTI